MCQRMYVFTYNVGYIMWYLSCTIHSVMSIFVYVLNVPFQLLMQGNKEMPRHRGRERCRERERERDAERERCREREREREREEHVLKRLGITALFSLPIL